MKLQLVLVLLTLLAGTKAVLARTWWTRLGWFYLVLSFGVLTLAYAARYPTIWAKQPDGRLETVRAAVMWPGHLLNEAIFRVMRLTTSSRPFDEITPGLFLGRRLAGSEGDLRPFRTVLDLTSEFTEPAALRGAMNYRCLPVLDHTPPRPEQLRAALEFLESHREDGPILVHCAAGHGRSVLVLAAWLLHTGQASDPEAAMARLRQARPNVALNAEQRAALESWWAGQRREENRQ